MHRVSIAINSRAVAAGRRLSISWLSTGGNVSGLSRSKIIEKHPRIKPGGLPEEVAAKDRDTLAALVTARIRANDDGERNVADASTRANSIRVVLHLELAPHRSKLFASKLDHANIQQRLRQLVKAIDPHSLTVDRSQPNRVPWNVRNSSDRRSTD
jgi:hypothetical protein